MPFLTHRVTPAVCHRDLRSGNVLYRDFRLGDGTIHVKIADFGLAVGKRCFKKLDVISPLSLPLERWEWMAPETGSGNYDERADIYSLGMLVWECFSREVPYKEYQTGLSGKGAR